MRILKIRCYSTPYYYDILFEGLFPFYERLCKESRAYKDYRMYEDDSGILIYARRGRKEQFFSIRIRNNVVLFNFPRSVSI